MYDRYLLLRRASRVLVLSFLYFGDLELVAVEPSSLPNKKTQDLYRDAENYLSQGDHLKAQASYRSLLKSLNPQQVGLQNYIDISLRYIESLQHEHQYSESLAILDRLFKLRLKDDLLIKISFIKADIYKTENDLTKSYDVLKNLEKRVVMTSWPKEQQQFLKDIKKQLNEHYSEKLRHADLLFDATLYTEANTLYSEVLEAISLGNYPTIAEDTERNQEMRYRIRYRLALGYYLAGNERQTIVILNENSKAIPTNTSLRALHNQSIYLTALAHKNLLEHDKTLELLKTYLLGGNQASLPHYNEAKLEIGLAQFELGMFLAAREQWEELSQSKPLSAEQVTATKLHLARLDIAEGKFKSAEKALSDLELTVGEDNPFYYEILFFHGETLFQMQEYVKAAEYFERVLPNRNALKASWTLETLERLGASYLKLGDDPLQDAASQKSYFSKAEDAFNKRLEASKDERAYLALGNYYLTRGHRLNDKEALQKAESVLSKSESFISRDAQTQSLILRTEAASSYADRDKLYRQLTLDSQRESPLYSQGWYLRGLNDFEEGQRLLKAQQISDANKAFERSISSLKKAFDLLHPHDKIRSGLALKYQAQAYAFQNTYDSRNKAFAILDDLIQKHTDIWTAMVDPDEIYYQKGLLASQIAIDPAKEHYAIIAEESLREQIARFPDGKYVDESLNLLGTIAYLKKDYLAAKGYFLLLGNEHSNSPYAPEAYYWAAKCAEELQESPDVIRGYRRIIYEKYPQSTRAAEAYFTYYSYSEYINGESGAIKHLQGMPSLFPSSPLLLNAYYLIGLDFKKVRKTKEGKLIHRRNLTAAIDSFQEVESTFDTLYQANRIPLSDLEYFITIRYRAIIERALANEAIAEESKGAKRQIYLEYAADVFRSINADFEKADHPLTQHLTQGEIYTSIQEQSEFGLAQTYVQANEEREADKTLLGMIEKYRAAKITRGYFLSRAWGARALMSMRQENYSQALAFLNYAEDAAKGKVLNSDEKLDLWIQQSLCYKNMKQLDQAMLVLSKVINEDAASSLRLKAMVMRAEIYQQQGRHELARKQLEATAKKGGEWALKAKEKLEKDYGYQ